VMVAIPAVVAGCLARFHRWSDGPMSTEDRLAEMMAEMDGRGAPFNLAVGVTLATVLSDCLSRIPEWNHADGLPSKQLEAAAGVANRASHSGRGDGGRG
jgi:hypothetical protein